MGVCKVMWNNSNSSLDCRHDILSMQSYKYNNFEFWFSRVKFSFNPNIFGLLLMVRVNCKLKLNCARKLSPFNCLYPKYFLFFENLVPKKSTDERARGENNIDSKINYKTKNSSNFIISSTILLKFLKDYWNIRYVKTKYPKF